MPFVGVSIDDEGPQRVELTADMLRTEVEESAKTTYCSVKMSVQKLMDKMGLSADDYFFGDNYRDYSGNISYSSLNSWFSWTVGLNPDGILDIAYHDQSMEGNGILHLVSFDKLPDIVQELIQKNREIEVPVCNISDGNTITYLKWIPDSSYPSIAIDYQNGEPNSLGYSNLVEVGPYADAFSKLMGEQYSIAWFQQNSQQVNGIRPLPDEQQPFAVLSNYSWNVEDGYYLNTSSGMVYVQIGDGSMPIIPGTLGTEVNWPGVGGSSTTNASSNKGPHTGISKSGSISLYSWAAALSAGMFALLKRRSKREA